MRIPPGVSTWWNKPASRDIAAVITLSILVVLFAWKLVFTNLILPRGDMYLYFYPYWDYRNAVLRSFRLPHWNPYLFMGAPFLANSQAGVFYPLNWPVIWFDTPTAVKYSMIFHIFWAALGTYVFARKAAGISRQGAVLSAVVFSLGGYLTAQVEHINQLQGLSWLPWVFAFWQGAKKRQRYAFASLSVSFAMQLLAGHTQTAFITGIGLGIAAIYDTIHNLRQNQKTALKIAAPLGFAAASALTSTALSAVQILPTLELMRLSNRGGGLTFEEAVSFSLRPQVFAQALLPGYTGTPLFSEYVAFIGVSGLMLAGIAVMHNRNHGWANRGLLLAVVGLFMSMGAYNPVYWLLVRFVPGFDLFRAPARWLVLYAFAVSVLAGIGLDWFSKQQVWRRKTVVLMATAAIGLVAMAFASSLSIEDVPGANSPRLINIMLWVFVALVCMASGWEPVIKRTGRRIIPLVLFGILIVELFAASRHLPYNDLSSQNAWSDQRPAITMLLAGNDNLTPPPRVLSMSDILYDPGDLNQINSIYGKFMDSTALFDFIVAVKHREVLSPNLPLKWRIPTVDGFDGGILPTRDYIQFTASILNSDQVAVDGRLREYLDAVPPIEWLRMTNTGWVITDKVADRWIDGVYYDTLFPLSPQSPASGSEPVVVHAVPQRPLLATAVGVVGKLETAESISNGQPLGRIIAHLEDGTTLEAPLIAGEHFAATGQAVSLVRFESPFLAEWVEVQADPAAGAVLHIDGVSLIDTRTGAFIPTTLSNDGSVRLYYAADVKIYQLINTAPRADINCAPVVVDTLAEALAIVEENPASRVIEAQKLPSATCTESEKGTAIITRYEPERVTIQVSDISGQGNVLFLADSYYPGWQVTIDGSPAEIHRANALFRAVTVPEGSHEVIFEYSNKPLLTGAVISMLTVIIMLTVTQFTRRS